MDIVTKEKFSVQLYTEKVELIWPLFWHFFSLYSETSYMCNLPPIMRFGIGGPKVEVEKKQSNLRNWLDCTYLPDMHAITRSM